MMKIHIPTKCPCCDSPVVWVNDQIFCKNTACPAQLHAKLEHFAKTLGIKGLGPKAIEKLDLSDISELYYLDVDVLTEALGSEKVAEKLFLEIEKSRSADLATVIAAFSIPLIGNTAGKKIASVVQHIDEINEETCKEAGLGEKATYNLLSWLEVEFAEMRDFLPFDFRSSSKPVNTDVKGTVCITGKLLSFKTKADAYKALEELGFKPVESVTKTTNFLVDEENKSSSKRQKAEQYGIQIIDNLSNFINKVKND